MNEFYPVLKKISEYFIRLGYDEKMFESETSLFNQFSSSSKVDFVVKHNNKPYIVVEAKPAKSFLSLNDEDLKYDPSVRQVQTLALNSGSNYYVVTNGREFLWFETGEDGRPRIIEPIIHNRSLDNVLGTTFAEALNVCRELLKLDGLTSDFMYEFTLILLARFAVKNQVSPHDIPDKINSILNDNYSFNISLISRVTPKTLERCWDILSECKPENMDKKLLVSTLKLFAQSSNKNYNYRVTDKISEFLVEIAKLKIGQVILDPTANFGEITTAVALNNNENQVFSYCQSLDQYAFLALINKIIYNDISNVKLISMQDFVVNSSVKNDNSKPDVIITAFPFGNRFNNLNELGYRMPISLSYIEDYMLLASLDTLNENGRLVAIIPENMLFSGGKRERLRQYIVERYSLRSIISLPPGSILNSNAKVSIIVIDKKKANCDNVFFGLIGNENISIKNKVTNENNNSNSLLKAYDDFLTNCIVESGENWNSILIKPDVENLRVETYLSTNDFKLKSNYPLYPIKEVCTSIKRGTSIKNDDKGSIPFLGPAAIRANSLDENKASYTTYELLSKAILYVEKGTVILNNISSYLGAAAIYESDNPIAINQHLIALIPNTEKVLPKYLSIVLNNKDVNSNILRVSTGVTIPSITLENLKELLIPVPDLETQQKIVDSVNKIQNELNKIDEAKRLLESKLNSVVNLLESREV